MQPQFLMFVMLCKHAHAAGQQQTAALSYCTRTFWLRVRLDELNALWHVKSRWQRCGSLKLFKLARNDHMFVLAVATGARTYI
jgi:hypothetical protein